MKKYLYIEIEKIITFRNLLQFLGASLELLATSFAKISRTNLFNFHEMVSQIFLGSNV